MKLLSLARLLVTPWTGAYQAPPSTGFSRQEYWNGVPLPSPIDCYYLMNIVLCSVIVSLKYIPRSGITGIQIKYTCDFSKYHQILLHSTLNIKNIKNKIKNQYMTLLGLPWWSSG